VEQTKVAIDKGNQERLRHQIQLSYQTALTHYQTQRGLAGRPWITWLLVGSCTLLWCFTAYKTAQAAGAHGGAGVVSDII